MNFIPLLIFWSLWFLNFCARTVLSPLLPVIEDEFLVSHALAGALFFCLSIGYTIAVFLSGLLSIHVGYKRSIVLGLIILVASLFSLKYAYSYGYLAVCLFFIGAGTGIYLPCAIPLLTLIYSEGNWGKAIAFHETAASLSILAIPIITASALKVVSWRLLFVLMGAACAVALVAFMKFVPDMIQHREGRAGLSALLRRRHFWIMTVLWVTAAINAMGIYNILPLFLIKEKGLAFDSANTLFGVSRAGGLLVIVLIGFLLDRYSIKKILTATFLMMGISTMGLALAPNQWLLAAMLVAQATISTMFFPAGIMAIAKSADPQERSVFTGVIVGISSIFGIGIAPTVLGAIADRRDFLSGILGLGILTMASVILTRKLEDTESP
ncbi:MAG: MFS transporter [Deltaproteobacteria bacterium]|nr:MFS transporter [Deltaproteobacteria bacterium]MBW2065437.1 MFS transporter [Deltaproteobacteria bacterium]